MRFKFAERKLELLYTQGTGAARYGSNVVSAFLRAVRRIEAAVDERDLYRQKGLHYEKLEGDRAGQRSIRPNKQWRLILKPDRDAEGNFLWIIDLTDYH